jgi:hypothetical protein
VLERVAATFPREAIGTRDRLMSWYDVHARNVLYPVERALWKRRLF